MPSIPSIPREQHHHHRRVIHLTGGASCIGRGGKGYIAGDMQNPLDVHKRGLRVDILDVRRSGHKFRIVPRKLGSHISFPQGVGQCWCRVLSRSRETHAAEDFPHACRRRVRRGQVGPLPFLRRGWGCCELF